jgi:hypothetical protein
MSSPVWTTLATFCSMLQNLSNFLKQLMISSLFLALNMSDSILGRSNHRHAIKEYKKLKMMLKEMISLSQTILDHTTKNVIKTISVDSCGNMSP